MLFSGNWTLRLNHMHRYLCENLKPYSTDCCAVFPPDKLCLPITSDSTTNLNIVYKTYESNLTQVVEHEGGLQFQIDSQVTEGNTVLL